MPIFPTPPFATLIGVTLAAIPEAASAPYAERTVAGRFTPGSVYYASATARALSRRTRRRAGADARRRCCSGGGVSAPLGIPIDVPFVAAITTSPAARGRDGRPGRRASLQPRRKTALFSASQSARRRPSHSCGSRTHPGRQWRQVGHLCCFSGTDVAGTNTATYLPDCGRPGGVADDPSDLRARSLFLLTRGSLTRRRTRPRPARGRDRESDPRRDIRRRRPWPVGAAASALTVLERVHDQYRNAAGRARWPSSTDHSER